MTSSLSQVLQTSMVSFIKAGLFWFKSGVLILCVIRHVSFKNHMGLCVYFFHYIQGQHQELVNLVCDMLQLSIEVIAWVVHLFLEQSGWIKGEKKGTGSCDVQVFFYCYFKDINIYIADHVSYRKKCFNILFEWFFYKDGKKSRQSSSLCQQLTDFMSCRNVSLPWSWRNPAAATSESPHRLSEAQHMLWRR